MINGFNSKIQYVLNVFSGDKKPVVRCFNIGKLSAALIYIDEITDSKAINRDILKPLIESNVEITANIASEIVTKNVPFGEITLLNDINKVSGQLLDGSAVLIIDNCEEFIGFSVKKWSQRSVEEPPTSSVVRGPREGFNEDLKTNLSLIRRKIKNSDLAFDIVTVGKYSATKIAVCYISSIADEKIVEKVKCKISEINIDGILDSTYIEAFLQEKRNTIFSTTGKTEKPDIVAGKILEGRIAVIVDGCPSALTIPYLFIESFQDGGDYYGLSARKNFLRVLRLASFLLSVLLPGIFVSILLFHYEMLPTDLLLTVINARAGIPMNPMLEMLVTMFLFELLQEASVRMPRHLGSAMSIVGALILGDTAVKAGVISSPTVMISAVSALMIYNVPEEADIINILRFAFTILGGFIGFFGILVGVVAVCLHLLSLKSFGVPYMAPYAPVYENDKQDALLIKPITQRFLRPEAIPTRNRIRMKHNK